MGIIAKEVKEEILGRIKIGEKIIEKANESADKSDDVLDQHFALQQRM